MFGAIRRSVVPASVPAPAEMIPNRLLAAKDAKEVERCLASGALVNVRGSSNETALLMACKRVDAESIRLLLKHGALMVSNPIHVVGPRFQFRYQSTRFPGRGFYRHPCGSRIRSTAHSERCATEFARHGRLFSYPHCGAIAQRRSRPRAARVSGLFLLGLVALRAFLQRQSGHRPSNFWHVCRQPSSALFAHC